MLRSISWCPSKKLDDDAPIFGGVSTDFALRDPQHGPFCWCRHLFSPAWHSEMGPCMVVSTPNSPARHQKMGPFAVVSTPKFRCAAPEMGPFLVVSTPVFRCAAPKNGPFLGGVDVHFPLRGTRHEPFLAVSTPFSPCVTPNMGPFLVVSTPIFRVAVKRSAHFRIQCKHRSARTDTEVEDRRSTENAPIFDGVNTHFPLRDTKNRAFYVVSTVHSPAPGHSAMASTPEKGTIFGGVDARFWLCDSRNWSLFGACGGEFSQGVRGFHGPKMVAFWGVRRSKHPSAPPKMGHFRAKMAHFGGKRGCFERRNGPQVDHFVWSSARSTLEVWSKRPFSERSHQHFAVDEERSAHFCNAGNCRSARNANRCEAPRLVNKRPAHFST